MILQSLGVATGSGSDVLDAASLIGNIAVCGLGGVLVTAVIGLIKGARRAPDMRRMTHRHIGWSFTTVRSAGQEPISASLELAIDEIKDGYARLNGRCERSARDFQGFICGAHGLFF